MVIELSFGEGPTRFCFAADGARVYDWFAYGIVIFAAPDIRNRRGSG